MEIQGGMQVKRELVIVLDFGGQYNQLVARRVRECNVYCEIYSYKTELEKIKAMNPKGIILTGGPNSCYEADSPTYSRELFEMGIPVLGLCYGAQLMMHVLGGTVARADVREYGKTEVLVDKRESRIFRDVSEKTVCWMSHFDSVFKVAPGFEVTAHTVDCPVAAAENTDAGLYAIQFHPEVLHTEEGTKMLSNFVLDVCGCAGDWRMDSFVEESVRQIRDKVGSGRVLCALSGGVDSSVAAVLLSKAVGEQLTCVFVDHGLLRKNEGDEVEAVFGPEGEYDLNFIRVNAQQRFYDKLAGVSDPEQKRKMIGEEFIRVFEEEAKKIMWILRRLLSLFGICLRMRLGRRGWNWGFRSIWCSASRSRDRDLACGLLGRLRRRRFGLCRMRMRFTGRRLRMQGLPGGLASILQLLRICRVSGSWGMNGLMTMRWHSGR